MASGVAVGVGCGTGVAVGNSRSALAVGVATAAGVEVAVEAATIAVGVTSTVGSASLEQLTANSQAGASAARIKTAAFTVGYVPVCEYPSTLRRHFFVVAKNKRRAIDHNAPPICQTFGPIFCGSSRVAAT